MAKKQENSSTIAHMDSLSKVSVQYMIRERFAEGLPIARTGIQWAIDNKNDSILAMFYDGMIVYFNFSKQSDPDSAHHYTRLFVKHAELSGNKKLLLIALSVYASRFSANRQFDSAIVMLQKRYTVSAELHDSIDMINSKLQLEDTYQKAGNIDTAYRHLTDALDIYTAIKYKYRQDTTSKEAKKLHMNYIDLLGAMATYFFDNHNYSKSLDYYRELNAAIPESRKFHNPGLFTSMGDCFEALGQIDSAIKHYETALQLIEKVWYYQPLRISAQRKYGSLLISQGNNRKGTSYLLQSLQLAWKLNDQREVLQSRLALGALLVQQRQWQKAIDTMQAAAVQALKTSDKQALSDIYKILYRVNESTGNYKEALQYNNLSHAYSDSLLTENSLKAVTEMDAKYQAYQKNQQITLLQKDNSIQQLELIAAQRLKLFYISASVVLLAVLGVAYYFRQLQQKNRARRIKTELEAKALRAQMNPHFIFNCLNAIQELVVMENYTDAYHYLSRFSRLLRMVLHASERDMIPLRDEIEMCGLYVELESLRLKHAFQYKITTSPAMDTDNILFPTLLTQPFIENAIWHGLSPKQGDRKLDISFEEKNGNILCTITDNGIGREKAAAIKAAKVSISQFESKGMLLGQQRIDALTAVKGKQASLSITDCRHEDGQACGTTVEIQIPVMEKI